MRTRIFIALIALAVFVLGTFFYFSDDVARDERVVDVSVGGETVRAIVADTPELRERGLSGRESLAPGEALGRSPLGRTTGETATGEAMLFLFPEDGHHSFWMKDMLFSIDIIWISSSSTIVDIHESVSPDSYPTVFTPGSEARYVLELPAGFVASRDVKIGDEIKLPVGE